MKKIDNFDKIKPLLEFPSTDAFYFLQILQRKKDFPGERIGGSNNNSRLIKSYHITSVEHLETHREEIIKLCQVFGARAGINLNPRSFQKVAFKTIQKIADQMSSSDFYSVRKAYDSVCGIYTAEMDKRWLVDIDSKDETFLYQVYRLIAELHSHIENRNYRILDVIETKSGYHIITNPFNLGAFHQAHPDIEVHKNNPTLLYYEFDQTQEHP